MIWLIFFSVLALLACFAAGVYFSRTIRPADEIYPGYKMLAVCLGVVASLLVLAEALAQKVAGTSFAHLAHHRFSTLLAVFAIGAAEGALYEIVCIPLLRLWYYPALAKFRTGYFLLPIFWGFFILLMQDGYAIFRGWGLSGGPALVAASAALFFLIEGINILTRSWIYKGWLRNPMMLFVGWLVLGLTFIAACNYWLVNPFGL